MLSLSVDLTDPVTKASRDNLPEEDYLLAVLHVARKESEAACDACDADDDLAYDLCGTAFNCVTAFISVGAVLLDVQKDRWQALHQEIGQQIQADVDAKDPAKQRLLLALRLVRPACDAVERLHDQADPEGCGCSLCDSMFAARYNADCAGDMLSSLMCPQDWPQAMLDDLEHRRGGLVPAAADMPALVVASADLTVKRAPALAGPKRPRQYWEPADD